MGRSGRIRRFGLGVAIGGLAAVFLLASGVGAASAATSAGDAQVKAIVTYKSKPGADVHGHLGHAIRLDLRAGRQP
jgi:hypothetical protein